MYENIYSLEIFKGIDKQVVDSIVNNCPTRKYSKGTVIVKEGEQSNGEGYIIKKGVTGITINNQKIAELGIGNLFGEIALLNEEKRTASVIALEDIEVIVLSLENLIEMINNDSNNINKLIINRIEENIKTESK